MLANFGGTDVRYSELRRRDVGLRAPADGQYVQIKHDWEVAGTSRALGYDYAFPAIVNKSWGLKTQYNGREYDYVPLPEAWQWFLWDLWKWSVDGLIPGGKIEYFYKKPRNERTFAYATPGTLTWYYVNMVEAHRAWTEAGSPEAGFRDYVTGRNPTAQPYQWLFRTTTGNLCKVIRTIGTLVEVEALDATKPPPPLEWLVTQPHLLHWATEVGPNQYPNGTFPVSNFPQAEVVSQMHGLPFMGTPIPFLSLGGSIILDKKATSPVENGDSYSPYNPPK